MLATVEVIVETDGSVRLLEPLKLNHSTRALLTLLEPLEQVAEVATKPPLAQFIGVLKNADVFSDDPVTLQRNMRDEWD